MIQLVTIAAAALIVGACIGYGLRCLIEARRRRKAYAAAPDGWLGASDDGGVFTWDLGEPLSDRSGWAAGDKSDGH